MDIFELWVEDDVFFLGGKEMNFAKENYLKLEQEQKRKKNILPGTKENIQMPQKKN